MPITEKLFSLIHNDVYLSGTRELEGASFDLTITFFLEYVDFALKNEAEDWEPEDIKNVKKLKKKLEYLKKYSTAFKKLLSEVRFQKIKKKNIDSDLKELEEVSNSIKDEIYKLKPGNSILIPGGWLNKSGGHAIIFEFSIDQDGSLMFMVHNTGAGLNYHQSKQGFDKERFCPIKAYKIPENYSQERLNWFLKELIKPLLKIEDYVIDAKELYEEVFPKISFLNGELVDSFEYTKQDNLTAGQWSGTCSEKSLHQMSEGCFKDKGGYKRFIYGFKKYSLQEMEKTVKKNRSKNKAGIQNQISLAIENMGRLLLKHDYFSQSKKEEEAEFLKDMQKKYSKNRKKRALPIRHSTYQKKIDEEIDDLQLVSLVVENMVEEDKFQEEAEESLKLKEGVIIYPEGEEIKFNFDKIDSESFKIFMKNIDDL